jgi:hypothetical protein
MGGHLRIQALRDGKPWGPEQVVPVRSWSIRTADPTPLYTETIAATGYQPADPFARAARSLDRFGFTMRAAMVAAGQLAVQLGPGPRTVWQRWAAACRAEGIEPPVSISTHRADLQVARGE